VTPTLGVAFASPGVATSLKVSEGALIQTVDPSGPAAKAGLLGTRRGLSGIVAGDVVLQVNGRRVKVPADVDAALDAASVGDVVPVRIKRGVDMVRPSREPSHV
jgi:S1-C subfamily serine protease